MRFKTFITLLFVLWALVPLASLEGWPVARYTRSIFPLETSDTFCSSVLVGANGVYLSARHCHESGGPIAVRGVEAKLLYENADVDLLVVQAPVFGTPLPVAAKPPAAGAEVIALGFGNASPILTPFPAIWIGEVEAGISVVSTGAMQGMSGGALVTRKGQLVGILRSDYGVPPGTHVTDLVPLEAVQAAVKQFVR